MKASKDYVYRLEDIDLGEGRVNQIQLAGGNIYGYGYSWSEDGEDYSLNFYRLKEDGTLEGLIPFRWGKTVMSPLSTLTTRALYIVSEMIIILSVKKQTRRPGK